MLRGTTVLLGTFTLICSQAGAQMTAARPRTTPAPAARGSAAPAVRIATIPPARAQYQPPPIPTTGLFTNIVPSTGLFTNVTPGAAQQTIAPRPVSFFFVPAVALSDGRIFANFNGAYEEVLRQCPAIAGTSAVGFIAPACWIVDANGRYSVIQRR